MGFRQAWICFFFTLLLIPGLGVQASVPRNKGVGVVLGEPTGLTAKFWNSQDRAVDAGIAFSFDRFVFLYSDYLFHFKSISGIRPYAGIGGGLLISSGNKKGRYFDEQDGAFGLGVRIPLGAEWFIPDAPFGIFAELVPGIGLVPGTYGFFQGGVGARFYLE
ncbi:MAG: DUF3996 domain-containing protein [Bdellovibrionales bacterium]|nr:DUF3996 domain-containing protein [Bdellovibrionales bacterium]